MGSLYGRRLKKFFFFFFHMKQDSGVLRCMCCGFALSAGSTEGAWDYTRCQEERPGAKNRIDFCDFKYRVSGNEVYGSIVVGRGDGGEDDGGGLGRNRPSGDYMDLTHPSRTILLVLN